MNPPEGYTFYLRPDDGRQMSINALDVSCGEAEGGGMAFLLCVLLAERSRGSWQGLVAGAGGCLIPLPPPPFLLAAPAWLCRRS